MRHVYLVASKSKDKHTKIGAILVKNNKVISEGYNGICSLVKDNKMERYERPEKYFWFEHAERNSIFSAAKFGISTDGSILYTNALPCFDCTRALIQSGIKEIIVHKQWKNYDEKLQRNKWDENAIRSRLMLSEAGIPIRELDKFLNISAFLDKSVICI
jgi:dCMP deaminase